MQTLVCAFLNTCMTTVLCMKQNKTFSLRLELKEHGIIVMS